LTARIGTLAPYLLLASLSLFWGLNWPGMKIILSEITVWWFRALCLIAGGGILMSISALSGNRCRLQPGEIGPISLCGSFAILGWMVFSAYGVSLMPAGRASIIAFTMPLWATLAAHRVLGERVTPARIAGLLLGIGGLGVLIGQDLLILQRAPVGALFMLLAAVSWAIGTILVKQRRLAAAAERPAGNRHRARDRAFPRARLAQRRSLDRLCLHRAVPDELLPMGLFQGGRFAAGLHRRDRHADGAGHRRLLQQPAARRARRRERDRRAAAGAVGAGAGTAAAGLAAVTTRLNTLPMVKMDRLVLAEDSGVGKPASPTGFGDARNSGGNAYHGRHATT
jgi:hypothetical protein